MKPGKDLTISLVREEENLNFDESNQTTSSALSTPSTCTSFSSNEIITPQSAITRVNSIEELSKSDKESKVEGRER